MTKEFSVTVTVTKNFFTVTVTVTKKFFYGDGDGEKKNFTVMVTLTVTKKFFTVTVHRSLSVVKPDILQRYVR